MSARPLRLPYHCAVCGQRHGGTPLPGGTLDCRVCADCHRRDWWADAHNGPRVLRGVGWALLIELVVVAVAIVGGLAATALLTHLTLHLLRGGLQ